MTQSLSADLAVVGLGLGGASLLFLLPVLMVRRGRLITLGDVVQGRYSLGGLVIWVSPYTAALGLLILVGAGLARFAGR